MPDGSGPRRNPGNRSRIAAYPAAARAGSDGSAERAVEGVDHPSPVGEATPGRERGPAGLEPDSLAGGTIRIGRAPIRSQ